MPQFYLKRTLDPALLNKVANDAAVRPWLGGEGGLDLTPLITNPANVTLVNEYGGFVAVKNDQGLYEVHTLFLPRGRGPGLAGAVEESRRYMFTATDCLELVTRVPDGNEGAARLAKAAHFSEVFRREAAWPAPDGKMVGVSYQSLRFEDWRRLDGSVAAQGKWFHDMLEEAKRGAGSELPTHPDDEAHDRAVGAAVLMAFAGNALKGVWLYNRWAVLAGYEPVELLSEKPVVIDVRDAVVELRRDGMEVLLCR